MKIYEPLAFITFLALICLTIILGGPIGYFINIPSALVCTLFPICIAIITLGAPTAFHALLALRIILFPPALNQTATEDAQNIHTLIIPTYAAGILGTLIGWIQMLANLDDLTHLGPAIAISLLTILYALCIAEAILRPASRRIAFYHQHEVHQEAA